MELLASLALSRKGPRILDTAATLSRGPTDHINTRILQTMVSGIPLLLGLGTRISDPYVYVVS